MYALFKKSVCAEGKRRIMNEIAYSSESGMYFEADRVPGTYCSTGNDLCNDLDPDKRCNAGNVKSGRNII